jgi:hypothetical protein
MKHFFIICFALCIAQLAYAQPIPVPCEDLLIGTDSSTAINNDPSPNKKLNQSFEWRGTQVNPPLQVRRYWIPYNITSPPNRYLDTPFSINDGILSHFYLKRNQYDSQDGWELVYRNMGYDNSFPRTSLSVRRVSYPHFVMYNKFTSTVRAFVNFPDQIGTNIAFELSTIGRGADPGRGMSLNYNEQLAPIVASDFTPNVLGSQSLYENNPETWQYADFFVGYDPCVCRYETDLQLSVKLITSAQVQIDGILNGTINPAPLSSIKQYSTDFYSYFGSDPNTKGTKSGGQFFKDFKLIKNALSLVSIPIQLKTGVDLFSTLGTSGKFLKEGLNAVPLIGEILDYFGAFSGGGAKVGPQLVTVTPMALDARLNLRGTITTTFPYISPRFSLPGARNVGVEDFYPYYNEPLGVFALLEKPKVAIRVTQEVPTTYLDDPDGYSLTYYGYTSYQIKLIQDIKYVLNPSSNLTIQEIKVAIINNLNTGGNPMVAEGFNSDNESTRTRFVDAGHAKYSSLNFTEYEPRPNGFTAPPALKVMLNLRRTDAFADSNTQNVLLVLTYPAEVVSPPANFDWSSPDDALPSTRTINDTGFGAGSYDFSAADSIVIGPNVDLSPAAVLNMYAPLVVIKSAPGGDPDIRIKANDARVRKFQLHPDPIVTKPATSAQIRTACNTYLYTTSIARKRPDEPADAPTSALESRAEEASPLVLSPNPASDRMTITFHQEQIGSATVLVRDILGQPLIQQVYQNLLPNCEQRVELNTSSLSTGLYIVTVAVDGRQLQSRLSIQR